MGIFSRRATRVAVVQSLIVQGERERNVRGAMTLVDRALTQQPHIVCLTQAFATGVNFIVLQKLAERIPDGPTCQELMQKAAAERIHIVAGILERGDDGRIYDAAVLIDPRGILLGKYRRWMRWSGEVNYVSAGVPIDVIETEIGRVGLQVGYDVCFPEASQHYFRQEADLIVYCASIFEDLRYDVRHLCGARAIDNHCYVVFAGAIGEHQFANMRYMGGSCVCCDPYVQTQQLKRNEEAGMEMLAQAGRTEEFITADLYLEELGKARRKFPFHHDLRTALVARESA